MCITLPSALCIYNIEVDSLSLAHVCRYNYMLHTALNRETNILANNTLKLMVVPTRRYFYSKRQWLECRILNRGMTNHWASLHKANASAVKHLYFDGNCWLTSNYICYNMLFCRRSKSGCCINYRWDNKTNTCIGITQIF